MVFIALPLPAVSKAWAISARPKRWLTMSLQVDLAAGGETQTAVVVFVRRSRRAGELQPAVVDAVGVDGYGRSLGEAAEKADAAMRRQHFDGEGLELRRRGCRDDDIDAAALGEPVDRGFQVLPRGIDEYVGAEALDLRQPLLAPACDDDEARAPGFGELHEAGADRPGADDEDRGFRGHVEPLERVVAAGQGFDDRRLFEGEGVRNLEDIAAANGARRDPHSLLEAAVHADSEGLIVRAHVVVPLPAHLADAAADVRRERHPHSLSKSGDEAADPRDDPGHLVAEDAACRRGDLEMTVPEDAQIGTTERGGTDVDEKLVVAEDPGVPLLEDDVARRPVHGCLHDLHSSASDAWTGLAFT